MEPAATPQRHVSFYLEAMGGQQSLPVPASGQLQVTDSPGHSIGTFPREPGERYSWYLCPCQKDPVAWRVRGPADFQCKLCNAAQAALMVCSCGIVSPVDGRPACGWCGRAPEAPSHPCRSIGGGMPVYFDGPECPLCGEAAAAPAPSAMDAPAPAATQPAEATPSPLAASSPSPDSPARGSAAAASMPPTRDLTDAILSRLARATGGAAPRPQPRPRLVQPTQPSAEAQAPPRPPAAAPPAPSAAPPVTSTAQARIAPVAAPPAVQPVRPPAAAPGAAAPQERKRSPNARLATVAVVLALCAGLAWFIGQWVFRLTTYGRALAAIERADLLEPAGSSAVDLYDQLAREEPGSANLQDLGRRITAVLRPWADAQLHRFYAESAEDVPWPRLAASYAFLSRTAPEDREALARQRYCNAQVAFGRGDYQEALDGYKAALQQHPQWALALNGLGRVHVRAAPPLRDYEAAQGEYQAAHQADPQFIFPLVNLAGIALLRHRPEEAPGYLRQAIDISPKDATLYRDLGQVFVQLHRKPEAIRAFQECLRYAADPALRAKVESALRRLGADPAAPAGSAP